MIKLTLSTGSLYTYGVDRVFALAAGAGFDAVEVLVDARWDTRHPRYLCQLVEQWGLPIAAVHSPFMPHVPGWPGDDMGRLERSAALARAVGAGVVVAHLPLRVRVARVEFLGLDAGPLLLPIPFPRRSSFGGFLLEGLATFEETQEVRVGVENMPAKLLLSRRLNFYALNKIDVLAGIRHLTLDTTHIGTWGLDLLAVYERLQERIVHVHLSNFDGQEHRRLEQGHLPLAELLHRLARDGYTGTVSLELGPDVLEAEDESRVRAHLRQVVDFCRKHTSQGQDPLFER